jgi:hypothetical protein
MIYSISLAFCVLFVIFVLYPVFEFLKLVFQQITNF